MTIKGKLIEFINQSLDILIQDPVFLVFFNVDKLNNIEGEYYLSNKKKGIEAIFDASMKLVTIHLDKKFGKLDPSLIDIFIPAFETTRQDCIKMLGTPYESGGGEIIPILGQSAKWDRYIFDNISIRLEYFSNLEAVSLITLASLGLENYFEN